MLEALFSKLCQDDGAEKMLNGRESFVLIERNHKFSQEKQEGNQLGVQLMFNGA